MATTARATSAPNAAAFSLDSRMIDDRYPRTKSKHEPGRNSKQRGKPVGKHAKMVAEIEKRISRLSNEPGQCLHIAHAAVSVLHKFDQYAVIQAGSLQWPRLRPEDDDGVVNTHFAYMWGGLTPESVVSMAAGNLPEIHVWAGLPDEQIIVDFSTRYLTIAAAQAGHGLDSAEAAEVPLVLSPMLPAGRGLSPERRGHPAGVPYSEAALQAGLARLAQTVGGRRTPVAGAAIRLCSTMT